MGQPGATKADVDRIWEEQSARLLQTAAHDGEKERSTSAAASSTTTAATTTASVGQARKTIAKEKRTLERRASEGAEPQVRRNVTAQLDRARHGSDPMESEQELIPAVDPGATPMRPQPAHVEP